MKRRARRGRAPLCLAVAVGLLGWGPLAAGQEAGTMEKAPPPVAGERRELAGHAFIPSVLARDPFATTYFESRTAAGLAEGDGPLFDATGAKRGTRDYQLAALSEAFELQVAPLRWLALRAGGAGTAYSGTTARSVVGLGASGGFEGDLGLTVGANLGPRVRLGALFDFTYGRRDSLDVLRGVSQSIGNRQIQAPAFRETNKGASFRPALCAAMALHQSLGLVVNVQYDHETEEGITLVETGDDSLAAGVVLDLDFEPLVSFPLDLLAGYRFTAPLGQEGAHRAHAVDAGFFYTGRRELDLGVVLGLRRFPATPRGVELDAALATLSMRYYW
jgi:hypothetical protein